MQSEQLKADNSISHKLNSLPDMLSVTQVATLLNVHRYSVLRYIGTGFLQGVRVGGMWRIKKTDLAHIINGTPTDQQAA